MTARLCAIVLSFLVLRSSADLNVAFSSYDNDFVEPSYILGKNWNATTTVAQESIVQWADFLAAQGPWCVCISLLSFVVVSDDALLVLVQPSPASLFLHHQMTHTIILVGHHSASNWHPTSDDFTVNFIAHGQTAPASA